MIKKTSSLLIDNKAFEFEVEGDFFWGKDELLFERENNIISKVPWRDRGYAIVDAFSEEEFVRFKKSIQHNIAKAISRNIDDFNPETFELENYHKIVTTNDLHYKVIDITRNLENKDFDFDINVLAVRFGKLLGYKLTSWVEELKKSHIQIRISRPNSLDINPPHRDGYLSFWKDILNIWIPVVGCNENSSLPVLPSSHLISENHILRTVIKGAKINGNLYNVPCIVEIKDKEMSMIRPNPKESEALIFTPFLIHGSAVNQNKDITRVSVELRFPKL